MTFEENSNGMKKIAILGYGREGKSIFRFLKKSSNFKNYFFEIRDKKLSKDYLKNLNTFDIIFRSPGIPYLLPEIQQAKKSGTKISSATELFFELCPCKIIGITGTKGKSTTSTLIYKILKASGKDVYLAGNIGKPALEILPKLKKDSFAVLELSSFQLQGLSHSPNIAVVLDVFPDHMDAHKNFKEYFESKANIVKFQSKNDIIFYFDSSKNANKIVKHSKGKKKPVLTSKTSKIENIIGVIKLPGEHQVKNAIMAASVAKYLKIPGGTILKTISKFKGLPNRLELIRKIKSNGNNINFYNDSASTNPHTAAAAVSSLKDKTILIAGGKDKNLNYTPLKISLKNSSVIATILYGENSIKIGKIIVLKNREIFYCNDLNSAVQLACKLSKSQAKNRGIINILLSPASASFDQFRDYKHRGDEFKRIVKNLKL